MTSAYINRLKQEQNTLNPKTVEPPYDLQDRFLALYTGLPEISRNRPFSMLELEQVIETQGKYLGPVLLRLGWTRHRRWTRTGEYNRYWMPPSLSLRL